MFGESFEDQSPTLTLNPLLPDETLSTLLWLTPDDFTRQWQKPLVNKGLT